MVEEPLAGYGSPGSPPPAPQPTLVLTARDSQTCLELYSGPDSSLLRRLLVHWRTVGSIPGFYSLDASSTPVPQYDKQKCLQILPHVPCRNKITPS